MDLTHPSPAPFWFGDPLLSPLDKIILPRGSGAAAHKRVATQGPSDQPWSPIAEACHLVSRHHNLPLRFYIGEDLREGSREIFGGIRRVGLKGNRNGRGKRREISVRDVDQQLLKETERRRKSKTYNKLRSLCTLYIKRDFHFSTWFKFCFTEHFNRFITHTNEQTYIYTENNFTVNVFLFTQINLY